MEGGREIFKPKAQIYEWQTGLHTVQEVLQAEKL
jgi:hypothetical protein